MKFNAEKFRVECPVCLSRRKLNETEISEYETFDFYHAYQFCNNKCLERADQKHKVKVDYYFKQLSERLK